MRLAVALAAGLLIDLERGWQRRGLAEGTRVAGVRTFGLIGLLGGVAAVVAKVDGEVVLAAALFGFGLVVAVAHWQAVRSSGDLSATTAVAALVTFGLGAAAGLGELAIAGARAVVTTLLLGIKPQLHGLVARIEQHELLAVVKLLLISVVLLPVLPDQGYGPWQALNPYRIWWMVVLVAGISSVGYFAIRLIGAERGVLLTGALGGLASSTATTLSLARLGRRRPESQGLLAAGILLSCGMMFPRSLLVAGIIAPALLGYLLLPLLLAGGVAMAAALGCWRLGGAPPDDAAVAPRNPFEFSVALEFGLLLAAVLLLAQALQAWIGPEALYGLAAASGLADVDAVTLSMGTLAADGNIAVVLAAHLIVLAGAVNSAVKAGLTVAICGGRLALLTGLGLLAAVLVAGLCLLLPPVPL